MRNKFLIITTSFLIVLNACKKDDNQEPEEISNCGENNGCIISQTIDVQRNITSTYNSNGKIVKRVFLDKSFTFNTSFPHKENITDYFYDDNGYLVKSVNVYYRLKHPTTISDELYIDTITHIYTNNINGKVIKDELRWALENPNGYGVSKSVTTYKYNSQNQLELRSRYSPSISLENLDAETVYTYDAWGHLIKKQDRGIDPNTPINDEYYSYINPLNIINTKYTYKYNSNDRLESMRLDIHDPDVGSGPYDKVIEYKYYYNNCGDTTKLDYYYDESPFIKGSATTEYELEYDAKGNLSRKQTVRANTVLEDIKYIYNCP